VFRAAHSIKGGAGTFGFDAIAGLTHVLETLLDELRAGKRALEGHAVDAMLSSVDVARLLREAEHGQGRRSGRRRCGEGTPGGGSVRPGRSERPAPPQPRWTIRRKPGRSASPRRRRCS
jgi:chemotaxis protein histidine kinase CheA